MSMFKHLPELSVEPGQIDGLHCIVTKTGDVIISNEVTG